MALFLKFYCHHFTDFAEAPLKDSARSWRLPDQLIGVRAHGMQVEVLFYPVGRYPWGWEVEKLSNIDVCPVIGPFEQGHHGPTGEIFEILEHIRYIWMRHSGRLYSPLDTPEPVRLVWRFYVGW